VETVNVIQVKYFASEQVTGDLQLHAISFDAVAAIATD